MNILLPGDVLIIHTKVKKSNRWFMQRLTVEATHKGKTFVTVTNGIYRESIDLWDMKKAIKEGKVRIELMRKQDRKKGACEVETGKGLCADTPLLG